MGKHSPKLGYKEKDNSHELAAQKLRQSFQERVEKKKEGRE